jgi:hypothetical protein
VAIVCEKHVVGILGTIRAIWGVGSLYSAIADPDHLLLQGVFGTVLLIVALPPNPKGNKSQRRENQNTAARLLVSAAVCVLLTSAPGHAVDVAVHSLVVNPNGFDQKAVTLEGTAESVKETTSGAGNDYTTFKLEDPNGASAISIFLWGHPALMNGDHVRVEGVFETEYHQGPYTFYSGVEATKVTPWSQ